MSGALRDEIAALGPWFHNLRLPDGTQTCPDHFLGDFPTFKWEKLAPHLPARLDGWRCLDIGCNAGFYSFELARRGADVRGIDVDDRYLAQARWAAPRLGLEARVRFERAAVYDLAREDAPYDLVLFMGVFYHLRYPLLALDLVSRLVGRRLVFQTLTVPGDDVAHDPGTLGLPQREVLAQPGWPKMAFCEHGFHEDPTNWWVPNRAAAEALLRSTGMRPLARPLEDTWLCEPDRESPSSFWTWNAAELATALGRRD